MPAGGESESMVSLPDLKTVNTKVPFLLEVLLLSPAVTVFPLPENPTETCDPQSLYVPQSYVIPASLPVQVLVALCLYEATETALVPLVASKLRDVGFVENVYFHLVSVFVWVLGPCGTLTSFVIPAVLQVPLTVQVLLELELLAVAVNVVPDSENPPGLEDIEIDPLDDCDRF